MYCFDFSKTNYDPDKFLIMLNSALGNAPTISKQMAKIGSTKYAHTGNLNFVLTPLITSFQMAKFVG